MQIIVKQLTDQTLKDIDRIDGAFVIDSKLILSTKEGNISYEVVSVLPYQKHYDKDIVDDAKALGLNPRVLEGANLRWHTFAYRNRGNAYASVSQYDKAIADYDKAIEMDPSFADAYYRKAWILATCLDAKYRDGAEAVELAKEAVWLDPRAAFYDSLAAAYAEVGRFEDAIKTQEKFIDLLQKEGKPKNLIDEERLKSYKDHKPWREKYVLQAKR